MRGPQSYHVWNHLESGDSIIRTSSYSLPQHLHEHIDVIQPTTAFARLKPFKSTVHRFNPVLESSVGGNRIDPSCNSTVTISCLKQLYGAVSYKPSAKNGNRIGLTGYLGQNANIADLQLFYANQTPAALNSTFSVVPIKGFDLFMKCFFFFFYEV
jgi:tripeptidyl-peptidase-1